MLVGGPLAAWAMNHVAHDVIVISDSADGAVAVRRTSLGKALRTYSADYVGPDESSPEVVDVEGLEAKFPG